MNVQAKKSDSSVQSTTIGGALAIMLGLVLQKTVWPEMTPVEFGLLVASGTTIFNYFVPANRVGPKDSYGKVVSHPLYTSIGQGTPLQ